MPGTTSSTSRLLAALVGLFLVWAAYRESALAYAAHLVSDGTEEGFRAAYRVTPKDASLSREAAFALAPSNPTAAMELFQQAIDLNANDTSARIGLGLLAESAGQLEIAESHLRTAANSSRLAAPRLALAGFYGRQGPIEKFWQAVNETTAINRADLKPLFSLVHAVIDNSNRIVERLELASPHATAAYLQFLLDRPQRTPIGRVAFRLDPVDWNRQILLAAVERLLSDNDVGSAVRIWNRLHSDSLDPARGRSITNPSFTPGAGKGFDWRHGNTYGVDISRATNDLRIEFSGRQPENVVLIEQSVPALPQKRYRLLWSTSLVGNALPPGVFWQVGGSRRITSASLNGAGDATEFVTRPGEALISLALVYSRPVGATRLEGTMSVRSVDLRLR